MGIFTVGPGIAHIHGSIGSVTFSTGTSGTTKVSKKSSSTKSSLITKHLALARTPAAKEWWTLSQANRDSWNIAAANNTIVHGLYFSGFQAFTSYFCAAYYLTVAFTRSAPTISAGSGFITGVTGAVASSVTNDIRVTVTNPTSGLWQAQPKLWACKYKSSTPKYAKRATTWPNPMGGSQADTGTIVYADTVLPYWPGLYNAGYACRAEVYEFVLDSSTNELNNWWYRGFADTVSI